MDKASASYRERAAQNRSRVKRIVSPDTSKQYGIKDPDRRAVYYYTSKSKRNRCFDVMITEERNVTKIDPR